MITAIEGADVTIGDDCMLATGIEIRSDDAHPIYSVKTGERVNMAQSIVIGNHVWIAKHVAIMGGVRIGSGSVIGYRSIVTSDVANNAIAVGAPARVVRRDIAWERPMMLNRAQGDVLPAPGEKSEQNWATTDESSLPSHAPVERPEPLDPGQLARALADQREREAERLRSVEERNALEDEAQAAARRQQKKEITAAVNRAVAAAEKRWEKQRIARKPTVRVRRKLRRILTRLRGPGRSREATG
ncbi:acyltransferase [Tessaracoccus sp. HDW20]|uniref:acyltransferase n=1 Tax=Tessaracoccus coleopterorum TaxID=2714950 RepID=UPI0018D2A9B1|nr:acyltransferase [Tessaracoccus coleopterorum]NHB85708.1 acyltransferase [Tessaracoccus coleopterorum]